MRGEAIPLIIPVIGIEATQKVVFLRPKKIMQYGGTVYLLSNKYNSVLYTGVTADLYNRIKEHKEKVYPNSFTAKYNCDKLVWYESYSRIEEAIDTEKRIKGGNRKAKEQLINERNPEWKDLWEEIIDW